MEKSVILFLIFIGLMSCNTRENYDLAIENVTVFESETQTVLNNKTILIKSDSIATIVNADEKVYARKYKKL